MRGTLLAGLFALTLALVPGAEPQAAENAAKHVCIPAVLSAEKTQHVFARNADGDIVELFSKQGVTPGWEQNNLTNATKAPKAAGNPCAFFLKADGTEHVVYRGMDGQMNELYFSVKQGKWQRADLTEQTKAPKAASDPSGFAREDDKTVHVAYTNTEGEICELFCKTTGDDRRWQASNLSSALKAPAAAGRPAAYYLENMKSQHIAYRGTDGQIHELYYTTKEGKWHVANTSAQVKAPKAASDPVGYAPEGDKTQHVFYRSSDGDLIELYNTDAGWDQRNLTTEARGAKIEGQPSAFFMKDGSNWTEHVVCRGADGQIYELYNAKEQGRWLQANLSGDTKAPKAQGDPVGYYLADSKSEHVIYRTEGGLYELFNRIEGNEKGWHAVNLTTAARENK